jgi:LacI family transcriptional regulator
VTSKLNTIGVVIKRDPGEIPRLDEFNYTILCGIENECERLGLNMMYASLPVNEHSHALTWSPLLESEDVDALIIVGIVFSDPEVTARIPKHIPVVLVDSYASGIICDNVVTQNVRGAYTGVQYLIEQGHSCIGLIGSAPTCCEHPSISERRQGYLKALADCGITQTYIEDSLLTGKSAYEATVRLLERAPEVTAIFACNDDVAAVVMRAVKDLKRQIPRDISVLGFDDGRIAANTEPPLTTVRVEKELMGSLAVRQLYERAANYDRPPITVQLGTRLVQRSSIYTLANRPELSA